jgi:Mn2+ and Fe2+ transporters of the NRAMP family
MGRPRLRALGVGLITGAADDDPSAVGTYASAGAAFGPSFLWTAPVMFPMTLAVIYLSSKLGQVSGKGLFDVLRDRYPAWLLNTMLAGVLIGNTIEAAADIGGMTAALTLLFPIERWMLVIPISITIVALQIWGSYALIRNTFRWLALALLAYIAAAVLAKPDPARVLRGTFMPTIHLDREFLSMVVAVIGTTCRRISTRGSRTRKSKRRSRWAVVASAIVSAPRRKRCGARAWT